MEEKYFIEVYKARKMYSIIRNSMELIDKTGLSATLKNSIKTELNKVLQFLKLKQLRMYSEKDLNDVKQADIPAGV